MDLCERFGKIHLFLSKYWGFNIKFIDNNEWVEFDLGETSFALLKRLEEKGKVQPGKTRIMFEIDNIERMREYLVSQNIKQKSN